MGSLCLKMTCPNASVAPSQAVLNSARTSHSCGGMPQRYMQGTHGLRHSWKPCMRGSANTAATWCLQAARANTAKGAQTRQLRQVRTSRHLPAAISRLLSASLVQSRHRATQQAQSAHSKQHSHSHNQQHHSSSASANGGAATPTTEAPQQHMHRTQPPSVHDRRPPQTQHLALAGACLPRYLRRQNQLGSDCL